MLFIALRKVIAALQKRYEALPGLLPASIPVPAKHPGHCLYEQKYFSGELKKILIDMKLTAFILLVFCLQIHAKVGSQNVTISERNAPLSTIFSTIEKQTGYTVAGNVMLLKRAVPVSIEARNEPLQRFLGRLLHDQGIGFVIRKKSIVLSRMAAAPPLARTSAIPDPVAEKVVYTPIRGRVTDSTGTPLSGASVKIKGSPGGTKTDAGGNFVIDAEIGQTLEISYVGYLNIEVVVRDHSPLNLSLSREDSSLEQLVVIGYGRQKEKDLTGAVSTVKGDVISKRNENQLSTALQGLAPGVT